MERVRRDADTMQEKYLWLAGKIKKGEIVMEGQRKTRLLLADDSITIRKVVEMTLPPDRFQITSVGDGEAALDALGNERPDVLLADVIMPKMDGYELCSVVRSSPEFKDIPVILLVGTFENYDEARGREAGADDYIVKPFETNDLIDKIREVTTRRAKAAEEPLAASSEAVPVMAASPLAETVSQETAGPEDAALESGGQVEFEARKEPAGLVEAAPVCETPAADVPKPAFVTAPAEEAPEEAAAGDENFPWEEEADLPEEGPVAAAVEEPPLPPLAEASAEEIPAAAEDHVFSLADLHPDVVEELEKGREMEGVVPAVSAVETAPPSPSALPGDTLEAMRECIEKSVHDAVAAAFGDIFREAVAKAAREVVPALVEKAVREELERQGG